MARSVNGFLGTFPTIEALTAKFPPSESVGCSANIGTSAPYSKAWCDGIQWASLNAAQLEALSDNAVVVSTWAARPSEADAVGHTYYFTDVGLRGSLWRSDGSVWGIIGGSVVLTRGNTAILSTAVTTEETMVTFPLLGGLMGPNGLLRVQTMWTYTSSAAAKTPRVRLGGVAFFEPVQGTSVIFLPPPTQIWNVNSESSQISFPAGNGNATVTSVNAATTGTVNTSVTQNITISSQKATAGEVLTLLAYSIELVRP